MNELSTNTSSSNMEEVYTSEGLSSEQQPQHQQQKIKNSSTDEIETEEISTRNVSKEDIKEEEECYKVITEESSIDPMHAFEIFQGKVFFHDNDKNKAIHPLQQHVVDRAAATTNIKEETKTQRLSRLRTEILSLENDIMSTSIIQQCHDSLLPHVKELTLRLDKANSEFESSKISSQSIIQESSINHKTIVGNTNKEENNNGSQLYELEKRMKVLEEMVGIPKNTTTNNESVLKRLEELEEIMTSIDEEKTNQSFLKSKIIRSDLEAALKARSKLSLSTTSSEDATIISNLHDQLLSVTNVSTQLPFIIQRLEQLSCLHNQSSTFSTRLMSVEKDVMNLERVVGSMEESMGCLDVDWNTNFERLQCFMNDLDQRMKELDKTK